MISVNATLKGKEVKGDSKYKAVYRDVIWKVKRLFQLRKSGISIYNFSEKCLICSRKNAAIHVHMVCHQETATLAYIFDIFFIYGWTPLPMAYILQELEGLRMLLMQEKF